MAKIWIGNGFPHRHPYHGQFQVDEENKIFMEKIVKKNREACRRQPLYRPLIELEDLRNGGNDGKETA